MFIAMAITSLSCCARNTVDNSTVPVDLNKYLGRWYEIAKYDHYFERDVDYATAHYSVIDNGKIKVVNSGMRGGESKVSVGRAKITDTPGLLRVSFFGPFYSDYRVMMVTPDYRYALVGSKSADYLWIMSRTPAIPSDTLEAILTEARSRGYDTSKLIWVKHTN